MILLPSTLLHYRCFSSRKGSELWGSDEQRPIKTNWCTDEEAYFPTSKNKNKIDRGLFVSVEWLNGG